MRKYKNPRLFEIIKINKTGKEEGKRLGLVKAKTERQAINKLQRIKKLPDHIRIYPVKIRKKKTSNIGSLWSF